MRRLSVWEVQAYADRDQLDEEALRCYYRCWDGGMPHRASLQIARDDMAIRTSLAKAALKSRTAA